MAPAWNAPACQSSSTSCEAALDPEAPKLLDNDNIALAVAELDRLQAVTAGLIVPPAEQLDHPYQVAAAGGAVVDGTTVNITVYVFATDEEASARFEGIEAAWTNAPTEYFGESSVEQRGRTLVVTALDGSSYRSFGIRALEVGEPAIPSS